METLQIRKRESELQEFRARRLGDQHCFSCPHSLSAQRPGSGLPEQGSKMPWDKQVNQRLTAWPHVLKAMF